MPYNLRKRRGKKVALAQRINNSLLSNFLLSPEDDASFTSDFPKLLKDIPKIHRETGFDLLEL